MLATRYVGLEAIIRGAVVEHQQGQARGDNSVSELSFDLHSAWLTPSRNCTQCSGSPWHRAPSRNSEM